MHCAYCHREITEIVVVRTDTSRQRYALSPGRGWALVDDRQTNTEYYDQYCGHCGGPFLTEESDDAAMDFDVAVVALDETGGE